MNSGARAVLAAVGACAALLAGCSSGTDGTPRAASAPDTGARARTSAPVPHTSTAPVAPERVRVVRTPCERNEAHKWVFVSLRRQHMWMCARHRVAAETAITSGMVGDYTHTPTGRYRVQGLNRNTTLTLNTGATYAVKYWIPFDAPLFGFHDSSWQHFPYGSPRYKTHGSHGCVHLPLAAIRFFYGWADIGTPVRITR